MASSVFNLVNNVAGAGILALAAGKAGGTGWIPAILICTILGALSAHSFIIIGEACELTGERDFKGLWSRTIGVKTTYIVDSMIAIMCLAASVIYSGILGDVCTPLLARAGLAAKYNSRTTNILAVNLAFLLPMSLIKDLSALAFTSILGFSAIMYTVLFSVVRAVDGSYKAGTGKFVTDGVLELLPSFDKSTVWNFDFTSLVLASNLGLAYISHYNAPLFYRSLKDTNSKRFGQMVGFSFALLILLYIVTLAGTLVMSVTSCHVASAVSCLSRLFMVSMLYSTSWYNLYHMCALTHAYPLPSSLTHFLFLSS
jgi:amino acid permease